MAADLGSKRPKGQRPGLDGRAGKAGTAFKSASQATPTANYDLRAMKGVILAGGTGSRLHPLTRITNKHLLPIHDRPMVNFAIEALVNAGIDELMLVAGGPHAGEVCGLLADVSDH